MLSNKATLLGITLPSLVIIFALVLNLKITFPDGLPSINSSSKGLGACLIDFPLAFSLARVRLF